MSPLRIWQKFGTSRDNGESLEFENFQVGMHTHGGLCGCLNCQCVLGEFDDDGKNAGGSVPANLHLRRGNEMELFVRSWSNSSNQFHGAVWKQGFTRWVNFWNLWLNFQKLFYQRFVKMREMSMYFFYMNEVIVSNYSKIRLLNKASFNNAAWESLSNPQDFLNFLKFP